MDFLRGVGNWFKGAFNGETEEEKKRKRQQQQQTQKPKPPTQNAPKVQTVNQLFGKKDTTLDQFGVVKPPKLQTATVVKPPEAKPVAPKPTKPVVDPNQYNEIKQKALGYQKPKVQDVNNYYGNDLKVLQSELAKGDKADIMRVQGLMTSLDNRTKELREFHKQRGESVSFKTARDLEEKVKSTRGDWSQEQAKLKQFWDGVSKNEKDDFIEFLNEKGVTKPADQRQAALNLVDNQNKALTIQNTGRWRNGNRQPFASDFSEDAKKVDEVKSRQQIADMAMQYKDVPLDAIGGASFQQYLDSYNKQDAFQQRDTIKKLEKTLKDNETITALKPEDRVALERKVQQTALLYNVLTDRGTKKENFGTKAQDFGDGAAQFGGALIESPGRVVQSGDTIARMIFKGGKMRGDELSEDYQKGKITGEEYNRLMNEDRRATEWAGTGNDGKNNALMAAGTAADTVATFLPIGSVVKGAKAASIGSKLATEGGEMLLKDSLKKTMLKEGLSNAGFSGVGALRDGEIDPNKIAAETALGGGLGVAAPVVGNKATQLWNKLRGARQVVPESVEDVGRVTSRLEGEAATEAVDDVALRVQNENPELTAIVNDANEPAFRRKQAATQLEEQVAATKQAEFDADPMNKPAYQVRREMQTIIAREEDNLNRFLNENPDLTPQQVEAAREAAQARVIELTDALKASRTANLESLDAQAGDIANQVEGQQAVNAEVTAGQVAANTPQVGDELQTPTGQSPEVAANDAYNSTFDMTDAVLQRAGIDTTTADRKGTGLKKFFHKATGGIISDPYKDMVDKIRGTIADVNYKATASGNVFAQAPGRLATLFGNNAVLKDSIKQVLRVRNDAQAAAGDAVKRLHDDLSAKVAALPNAPEFNAKLDQLFETPEFLARRYGDGTPNISLDDLAPAERQIAETLIEMNKMRNLALYKQGKISQGEFQMFADGMHSPRLYDFENLGAGGRKGNKLIDTTSTIKRKDLEQISDETFAKLIESPAQRMLIRLEMALRSQASHDALRALDDAGMLKNAAPNNQFSKLEGARWGDFQGKYVFNPIKGQLSDSVVMNTETGQKFSDLVDQYRNSPFGAADRFFKKTKTVYSPGTFVGNVASNPILFNAGAGVNALGQGKRMARAGFDLMQHRTGKKFDPDIYEAQKYGVFASDTGKQITGENNPQLSVANNKKTNPFEAVYGGADDAAKLAIWRGLRNRGVSPEKAAQRVAQFTQDYNNAGRLVRTLADMPVVGRPFARFAPELVRLVKNNVLYNPVGMVAGAGTIALIQKELSDNAGETPEEREARETAMGQTLIPGTQWLNKMLTGTDRNISLNFPVGDSAVNIARAVGLNFPQDSSGDPNLALIKSITPWAIPTRENAQGEQVFAPEELFTSMALSPIAQEIANRDFIGREISDPQNKTYYEGANGFKVRKYEGENNPVDAAISRGRHLLSSYVPLANEADALISAATGNKDYYDKERTVPEAIARIFGAKSESNTQQDQIDRVETKNYFEEDLDSVQKFVNENPDLADKYFQLKNPTRTRPTSPDDPGTKINDLVTPEKWDIINSDTSGRLFNFMKEQNIRAHEKSVREAELDPTKKIRPVDPIYEVPADQAKYVAELRSRPSGDDIEAQEILRATTDWFPAYEDRYHAYLDANSAYFDSQPAFEGAAKENPRVKEYGDASAPIEQPPIIKEYYRIKDADPEKAKLVYKANKEALSAAFDSYASQRLDRINKLRKIEGYEPISLEVFKNKTFGFDATPSGFGFGGGGGGGGENSVNTLGELTNYSNDIKGLPTEAPVQEMPNSVALFRKLMATRGGGRNKPTFGASSRGA